MAFLPRHGIGHEYPPHRVNYRANLWALQSLGVRRIIGPCAVGSLRAEIRPGDFVVLDQLVDRTSGRPDTYFDGPVVNHVSFADPYCPQLRQLVLGAAGGLGAVVGPNDQSYNFIRNDVGNCTTDGASPLAGVTVHERGTVVVIQGPRFSTRAESNWYRAAGWEVINMTQYPEAYLARELGMCYCGLALVTDYDTGLDGVDGIEPVTMHRVLEVLAANVARTRDLLFAAIPAIADAMACRCQEAGPTGAQA